MIILFGGKEYAVGLSWFSISSTDEIEQFKREMQLTHGVFKQSKIEGMPSAIALAPTEYSNQVSLAAALSYAHENLLYVCKTEYKDEAGRPLYYLCCVKRGIVTVDGDTMADGETILSLYTQNLMDFRNDLPADSIECLGTRVEDHFESAQPIDESQIITSIQRFESQCLIKELRKGGPSKLSFILLGIGFVGLCYLGYGRFFKAPPPPPPVVHAPAPPPVDPFTQFLNKVEFHSTITTAGLPYIVQVIKQIPLRMAGWDVRDIAIHLGDTTTFSVTLVRTPYSTMEDIKTVEASGLISDLKLNLNGEEATANWTGNIEHMPMLTREALAPIKTAKKLQFQQLFMSEFQANNIIIKIDNSTDVGGFSMRSFTYAGKGLWGLEAFNDLFHDMTTIGITSVIMKPNKGEYDWSLRGVIYG